MDFLILLLLFKGTFFSFDHPTFIWVKSESSLPNTFLQHDDNDVVRAHLLLKSSQLSLEQQQLNSTCTMLYSKYYYKVDVNKFQVCFGFLFKCPPQSSPFCASILFTLSLLSTFIPGDMCNKMAHVVECRGGLLHRHFYSMRCTLFIAVFAYYFDEIVK